MTNETQKKKITRRQSTRDKEEENLEKFLPEDQREELLSAFKLFEKSGKGKIPIRELGPLLRSLGRNPSEIELEEARNELDMQGLEGSGLVTFSDLEKYMAKKSTLQPQSCEEDILEAFQVLDKTGRGIILAEDFRFFMTTMGEKMTADEVDEIVKEADRDGTGLIRYEDFIRSIRLNT